MLLDLVKQERSTALTSGSKVRLTKVKPSVDSGGESAKQ